MYHDGRSKLFCCAGYNINMKTSQNSIMLQEPDDDSIRMKVGFNGNILVTSIGSKITYESLRKEIRDICKFEPKQPFTMKWVDEEGDPCILSCQVELNEAVRLHELNKDSELTIHVFPNVPDRPGMPCDGEDRNIYRRGARRWRKLYRINGHLFQAKRFSKRAVCYFCSDRIWGLGRQGYKCINCKLLVHKRCHKLVKQVCGEMQVDTPLFRQEQPALNTDEASQNGLHSAVLESVKNESSNEETSPAQTPSTEYAKVELDDGMERGQISLDDFTLLRVIGRGSYAKVLMVEQKVTKRIYAMKVIKKAMFNDEEDIDWINTEKHVFETATNYPFLVGLHSCFQSLSRLFFVIEFVNGGDLMFHMQQQRRLAEDHARFYAAEISLALNFLHERGIVYRDLKLDNVLLDSEGHIKLTDYGMCKEGLFGGETNTFCGTPNYIAPEILRGEPYDFSVDWWALGVLMFEMLAGRSPFDVVGSDNPDQNTEDYLFQSRKTRRLCQPRYTATLTSWDCESTSDDLQSSCRQCSNSLMQHVQNVLHVFCITWQPSTTITSTTSTNQRNKLHSELIEPNMWRYRTPQQSYVIKDRSLMRGKSVKLILEKPIRIPRSVSVKAASVLKGFLNKNPKERLGCVPDAGFDDIRTHAFFRQIDWELLEQKQITPPYKPELQSDRDLRRFDEMFTKEPVQLTPDDSNIIDKIDQTEFDGFEYVNPLLMSMDDPV
ncbi:protein kinase C iota type isoform X4 [Octopus sinensis]|uniref:protein kinase C n=1 Tax=Octopus sinensis TaxID=2607531 RepID=A0A7E6FPG0_9MOLL|nr:protein kinase C iota type isoform X4 [Octopus sinensis]